LSVPTPFFFSLVIQHTQCPPFYTLLNFLFFLCYFVLFMYEGTKSLHFYCCFSFALIETGVLIESNGRSCVHSRYIKERSYLYIYGKRVCVCALSIKFQFFFCSQINKFIKLPLVNSYFLCIAALAWLQDQNFVQMCV
jgi:hypothetical protein